MQFQPVGKIGYKVNIVRNLITLNLIALNMILVTADKRTLWSLILQSGHKWNCYAHTLGLLSVDVPLGFLGCSCGELGSSSGNRELRNDHNYGTFYIGTSWAGQLNPCTWVELPHLFHLSLFGCTFLVPQCFFPWSVVWFSGILWYDCLCLLTGLLFLLCLVVWNSVFWCCRD